jgi:hypothetical protein|tara:strand:+ start:195 stop:404 length:210 start_codon:yes stop_codon:yes gene_type:complete
MSGSLMFVLMAQAESYTTPSRGIEGKAGQRGVADLSPDNNIPLLSTYDARKVRLPVPRQCRKKKPTPVS